MPEQTQEQEIEQQRERQREVALINLKSQSLTDMAAVYFADHAKSGFGERDNEAMEKFKYAPVLKNNISYIDPYTGEKVESLIHNSLEKSRQDGKRYSGNISEGKIMNDCAKIFQESLNSVRLQDLLELSGSKKKVKEELAKIYLGDLNPQMAQEQYSNLSPEQQKIIGVQKQLYEQVIGEYQSYFTKTKVGEAVKESANDNVKGLESIICEAEK